MFFNNSKIHKIKKIFGNKILFLLIISILLGGLVGFIEIVFSFALQNFLGAFGLITSGGISPQYIYFQQYPVKLLIVVAFLQFFMNFWSAIIPNIAFEAFNTRIRRLITARTLGAQEGQEVFSVASVSHIFSNILPKVASFVSSFTLLISSGIVILMLFIGMGGISISLTMITLAAIVIFNIPMFFLKSVFQKYSAKIYNFTVQFTHILLRDLRNFYFLRIVGTVKKEISNLTIINNSIFQNYLKYITGFQANSGWPIFSGILIMMMIVYVNAKYNFIPPVTIVPFVYLLVRFSLMISRVAAATGQMQFCYPFVKEIFGYADYFEKFDEASHSKKSASRNAESPRKLEVIDLSVGRKKTYFGGVSFCVNQGDFLLISGKSGKGKTTLLMTLIGLIEKISGKILWNGQSIENIDREFLRKNVGYSGSDPFLVDDTIDENLLYGALDREQERERIPKAIELAQAGFINDLPGSLKYLLKEGGEGISSGQKQRISIARALLREPSILLLDEATANIDENTEETICRNIRAAYPQMIIIAVSHRSSLEKFAAHTLKL